MTTPVTVRGRALSDWSREGRFGAWYALRPGRADESPLGVLRIDRALLAPQGARERLASAVLAVAKLRLPGVPATVDLVGEAGDVWLIVARPPVRTVGDLLSVGAPGLDAGSAASVLNETAQTLLALHAAGLAHGSLTPDCVVLAPDGTALLAEAALATALSEDASTASADITAWAALARTLGSAWAAAGTPAAALFARCSETAESGDLAAARTTLTSGRAALPRDFLRRTALHAAATAALTELAGAVRGETTGGDTTGAEGADRAAAGSGGIDAAGPARTEAGSEAADTTRADRTAADPEAADAPEAVRDARGGEASDGDSGATVLGRRGRTSPPAASDEQATVLGRRNQGGPTPPLAPAAAEGDNGEILLRFGPGIPRTEEERLRALWAAPAPAPTRARRRRRA
ncbi:MAG TPA: hypothetical protein VIU94_21995, partial [Streptomyces sp.]